MNSAIPGCNRPPLPARPRTPVQIKLTAGNSISLFASCDRLIVLRVVSPEQAEIVYDGPDAPVWAAAAKARRELLLTAPIRVMSRRTIGQDAGNGRVHHPGTGEA